jgi:hypothetical protein
VIADVAQSIRQIIRVAMGMDADSVRPANQLAGAGTQVQHLATVEIIRTTDLGWPAITTENVDDTDASPVIENVDQLKQVVASVNFYRGGNADAAGIAGWTLRAVDDAARVGQRMAMSATFDLIRGLGLAFIDASDARDLTALENGLWKSRGQVDLTFNVVNRESSQIPTVGSGSVGLSVDSKTKTIEVPS